MFLGGAFFFYKVYNIYNIYKYVITLTSILQQAGIPFFSPLSSTHPLRVGEKREQKKGRNNVQ